MPVSLLIGIVFFISPPHQLYWFFCNLVENMSIQEIGQKNEHMFKCQRTYVQVPMNICSSANEHMFLFRLPSPVTPFDKLRVTETAW